MTGAAVAMWDADNAYVAVTKPCRRSAMIAAVDKWPACARLLAVAPAGRSTASYTTIRDTTVSAGPNGPSGRAF